jgi:hypothetical protein
MIWVGSVKVLGSHGRRRVLRNVIVMASVEHQGIIIPIKTSSETSKGGLGLVQGEGKGR